MIEPLAIPGTFRMAGRIARDERGSFRKVFDSVADDIPGDFRGLTEVAISHNTVAGTIRGMHWQADPHAQTKVVWVAAGRIVDVLVDVRPTSPAYGNWLSVELSADAADALLVPFGVAHGFQTLDDNSSVIYLMGGGYAPESARTLRWDDPTVAIDWPLPVSIVSESDSAGAAWPVY
ncbi:MAG: dTDP-4-dehydrorhamnose 3,5-epimerase family protein [Rhodoglobus sp.]